MCMRNPNHKCDNQNCNNLVYKRPKQLKKFCCRGCYFGSIIKRKLINCDFCEKSFLPNRVEQTFCSHVCSASKLRGKYSKHKFKNRSKLRLHILKETFGFNSCMVDGCSYNRTYNIHRLIQGKDGGKYEIGNMFAICPNHHTECHMGIISLEKINDLKLKLIEKHPTT